MKLWSERTQTRRQTCSEANETQEEELLQQKRKRETSVVSHISFHLVLQRASFFLPPNVHINANDYHEGGHYIVDMTLGKKNDDNVSSWLFLSLSSFGSWRNRRGWRKEIMDPVFGESSTSIKLWFWICIHTHDDDGTTSFLSLLKRLSPHSRTHILHATFC